MAGPACQEIGEHFGDRIRAYRLRNAVRLLEGVRRHYERAGVPLREVHPKLLFPILEHAFLEDDPTLSDLWAELLASAAARQVLPAYVDIAKQLSPDDAKLLRSVYRNSFAGDQAERDFDAKSLLPMHVRNAFLAEVMGGLIDQPDTPEMWDRMPIACQNLLRMRLLVENSDGTISLAILGYRFVRACEFRDGHSAA